MLNYRNISYGFVALLILFVLLLGFDIVQWAYFFLLLFAYIFILFLGAVIIKMNFYTISINRLKDKSSVLLTFDDGPHPQRTIALLDLLDEYQVKAVFCVIGKNAKEYPEVLKEVHQRGHLIANHSYSHSKQFDFFSIKQMLNDVEKANAIIEEIIGERPRLFRPPFGITNPRIHKLIVASNLLSLGWSFRSFDTTKQTNDKIFRKLKSFIKGGEILLFHDSEERNLELMKMVLPWLSERFKLNNNNIIN